MMENTYRPMELGALIEEWMLHNGIQGIYEFDNLQFSVSKPIWTDIGRMTDVTSEIIPYMKTIYSARRGIPFEVDDEPECEVVLYSGLLKCGNGDLKKEFNLPFDELPNSILKYLSIKSINLDLASAGTKTDASPNILKYTNPQQIQKDLGDTGPEWLGNYVCIFSLMAYLSDDVKITRDDGTVQMQDLKDIVRFLEFSDKTNFIGVRPEHCEWEVTGQCEFYLYG